MSLEKKNKDRNKYKYMYCIGFTIAASTLQVALRVVPGVCFWTKTEW
jgi:hypothetical protein